MASPVYFTKDINKATELFAPAGIDKLIEKDQPVALKIHFGEPGNTAYLKPAQVDPVKERIRALGGQPFYTDSNTLYQGKRGTTKDHLKTAQDHGYTNVIIPEDTDSCTVEVGLKHFQRVHLSGVISRVGTIIALTHFKGHELTGFGGVLKNLGMGFGTRQGKLRMHQDCTNCPEVKTCVKNKTIEACWVGSSSLTQEKIAEYAYGAVKDKKAGYFNFIINVSPNCDCYGYNEAPVVPDIGVLASLDPVAIDQASIDLVNQRAGKDIFRQIYPEVDWNIQLTYAEKIGLGSRNYQLVVK